MGNLDPVRVAQDILPPSDLAPVVRYNSAPYRPPLDLEHHDIATAEDVMFVGLSYVGFGNTRQNVRFSLSLERFCAHYKLCPEAILDAQNYFSEFGEETIDFKRLLFTLNFLKCCELILISLNINNFVLFLSILVLASLDDTENVLAGRWRLDEDTIRTHTWGTLGKIQYHRDSIIYFDPDEWDTTQVQIITVDTVNYEINEKRSDTTGDYRRWFDHKSHSAGVKYEMALPLCLKRVRDVIFFDSTENVMLQLIFFCCSKPLCGQEALFQLGLLRLLMMGVCFVAARWISQRASGTKTVCIINFGATKKQLAIHFMEECLKNALYPERDTTS